MRGITISEYLMRFSVTWSCGGVKARQTDGRMPCPG